MPDTALVAVGVAISTVVLQALLSWLAWWVLTGPGDLTINWPAFLVGVCAYWTLVNASMHG